MNRLQQRTTLPRFNKLILLLAACCITFSFLFTLQIHNQLHRHNQNADNDNNHHHPMRSIKTNRKKVRINQDGRFDYTSGKGSWRYDAKKKPATININKNKRRMSDIKNKNDQGLSACLLINDENPRLPEWIAYHYHILPLRSLTIAIDPASRTLPLDIIKRWAGELPNLVVNIWEDRDFLPREDSTGVIEHGPCNATEHDGEVSWRGPYKV
jgi:hypothetical protein